MQFGIISEIQPGPEPWEPGAEARLYRETLDQVVRGEEVGFDYAWLVEHHFLTGYSSSSAPEAFLGWLAAHTSRIRLGHGVVQVNPPTNHVLRIAERAAVLDIISEGRLDVGMGRALTHIELEAFGMDPAYTRRAQEEVVDILHGIWSGDRFSWKGEHYTLPEVRVHPRPVQSPHPPLWMAATQPGSLQVAARKGLGVLALGLGSPDLLRQPIADYRETVAGAAPASGAVNNQVAAAIPMFCAETDEEALETFGPHLDTFFAYVADYIIGPWRNTESESYSFYRNLASDRLIDLPTLTPDQVAGLSPAAAAAKAGVLSGFFCVGSPETCAQCVERWRDIGVDQLVLNCQLGTLPHESILRSLDLFGQEVMPRFEV
ncbi:LLM class flavin-dependent oxidoreductase [Streptomyces sp. NPDC048248]|uniref:LLM class flavin-dependent oxidoreductase n=1 Tax=Streptomyces sp. NPDC048248 TaxID=3365523 RepID=UPI003720096C